MYSLVDEIVTRGSQPNPNNSSGSVSSYSVFMKLCRTELLRIMRITIPRTGIAGS